MDAKNDPNLKGCGVIFDMDGVLVDSYDAHLESWRMLAREIGADLTEEQFAHTFGRTSRDIMKILFDITDLNVVRKHDDRKECLYRDLIRNNIPLMPGAVALNRQLKDAGAGLAVGSSGPRENVNLICDETELRSCISARVSGADVSHGKPDPEIFLTAAAKLGLNPDRCVVIEDAPVGIQAAHAGGMKCIALRSPRSQPGIEAADLIVDSLSQVTAATLARLL